MVSAAPSEPGRGSDVLLTTDPPTRDALRAHLVATGIAGDVATSREENLRHITRALDGDDAVLFGVRPRSTWDFGRLLAEMAVRVGISPDEAFAEGVDRIDPDVTIDQLSRMRDRLRLAARRGEPVLLATGHPGALLPVHLAVAARLRAAGCRVLAAPAPYVNVVHGVHALRSGGGLAHTHDPEPMRAALAALAARGERPALVVADHGWAGAAADAGIDTLGFADCNDPGLFLAEADGLPIVTVPLDDGIAPHHYDPLIAFVLDGV